jgi:hypothetical protein
VDWSTKYNSSLEYSKLALIDFAYRCNPMKRTPLELPQGTKQSSDSAKYLDVIFDQHLSWKVQHAHAIGKGSKWVAQIRRLSRPTWGITPKYAR